MAMARITRKRYWEQCRRCIWCGELTWCRTVMHRRDAAKEFGIILGEKRSRRALRHRMATAEHITPVSAGGTDATSNIVMACQLCNSRRSSDTASVTPHEEVLLMLPKSIRKAIRRVSG